MKRILLASASIVAFAGAAAAEVTFSGEAALGYNDTDAVSEADDDKGFYWDAELGITLTQELDNGLVAAATVTTDLVDNELSDEPIFADGFVLSLTSETAGLYFGDTDQAADLRWDGVSEMAQDGFSETDGETVLRGDVTAYGLDLSMSALVDDTTDGNIEGDDDTLDQYSFGAAGEFGAFQFSTAYQAEERDFIEEASGDFNGDEIFGISVGTAFAGADVDVAYARNLSTEEDSTGIEAAYPIGPVTVGGFYVSESEGQDSYGVAVDYVSGALTVTTAYEDVQGDTDFAVEAGFDFGMGLMAYAGLTDHGDDYYVATTYELAEGASLLVSYAKDDDNDSEDEIGDPEYQEGTTVEVNFEF
ncbi:porin [Limimaricola variabilis]